MNRNFWAGLFLRPALRKILAGIFLWPALWCAQAAWTEEPAPRPRLVVEEPVFESADLKPGTAFDHEFTLRNEGDAPLLIEEVQTGCSCTVAAYDRTIAPGGRGRVRLTIDVYREWAGRELRRTAWLSTNDPEAAQFSLVVRGRVAEAAAGGR